MPLIREKNAGYGWAALVCFCCLLISARGREVPPCPHDFVTAALYSRSGDLWVATEGGGLLKLPRGSAQWEKQQGKGLPETENFLSLAEDRQGRIWAGTDNRGAAVWNGETWAQYTQSNALPGERVNALAVSPLNGDVAIATSGGLTIYSPETETWRDYTRANGLPEDQAESLSFNEQGRLWAAFLTQGIACASPAAGYGDWKATGTTWYWNKSRRVRQPLEARGNGLPSNYGNAICAASGSVWVGTISGLGYGRGGNEWKFLRGKDYEEKNRGLWLEEKARGRKSASSSTLPLLPEDYVTCFYPVAGGVWAGFRESGVCFVREGSLMVRKADFHEKAGEKKAARTTCLVAVDGDLYAGMYGQGLLKVGKVTTLLSPGEMRGKPAEHPRPPVLSAMPRAGLPLSWEGSNDPGKEFEACYWYEDWATQGDWCGRYGTSYAMLCSMNLPMGDVEFFFDEGYECFPVRGPHANEVWMKGAVAYENEPEMRSILYCPQSTTRTLSSWGDGGEDYPRYFDGPDLGAVLTVPAGKHLLSLYFYDPTPLTEHERSNALRDYIIEVRKMPAEFDVDLARGKKEMEKGRTPMDYLMAFLSRAAGMPAQARTRVKSFSGGGVYKNFILNGRGNYYVRLIRNYSTNATLNGLFLSSLDETGKAWKRHLRSGKVSSVYGLKTPYPPALDEPDIRKLPDHLLMEWAKSQDMKNQNLSGVHASRYRGLMAYRRLVSMPGLEQLKANWRWRLKLWDKGDHQEFDRQMAAAWESLQDCFIYYRSRDWAHFSPETTVPFSEKELYQMEKLHIDWKMYRSLSPVQPEMSVEEMKKWLKEH